MNSEKREQIRQTLRSLAEAHAATNKVLEQTFTLLEDEFALDPFTFLESRAAPGQVWSTSDLVRVDEELFSVTYRGRSCFLGNSLPFRLLTHLSRRPNVFFTYEDLFDDVWQAVRSDAAIRSVVKTLRGKLREGGLSELADAIDGSVSGHYRLRLGG